MESATQQPQLQLGNEQDGSNNSNKSSSFLCRQTSSRWTPTTEQIRILKELYYNNGVRSPSAEQIQKISAKLRQYGKIEGKNVFYWFQNHKARERQKKRLTATGTGATGATAACSEIPLMQQQRGVWRSDDPFLYNKCPTPNFASGAPSSSAAMMPQAVSQFGKYGYGSMAMEKSFRDCSISQGGPMVQNFVWAGLDPYNQYQSSYTFLEKKNKYCYDHETLDDEDQEDEDEDEDSPGLETLPLFPMHNDHQHHQDEGLNGNFSSNMKQDSSNSYYGNWYHQPTDGNMGCYRASLELTLNSYGCMSPFSP